MILMMHPEDIGKFLIWQWSMLTCGLVPTRVDPCTHILYSQIFSWVHEIRPLHFFPAKKETGATQTTLKRCTESPSSKAAGLIFQHSNFSAAGPPVQTSHPKRKKYIYIYIIMNIYIYIYIQSLGFDNLLPGDDLIRNLGKFFSCDE